MDKLEEEHAAHPKVTPRKFANGWVLGWRLLLGRFHKLVLCECLIIRPTWSPIKPIVCGARVFLVVVPCVLCAPPPLIEALVSCQHP